MRAVVHGSNGLQGMEIAAMLTEAGHEVAGIACDPSPLVPVARKAPEVMSRSFFLATYRDADVVIVCMPVIADWEALSAWAKTVIGALRESDISRVILCTGGASMTDAGPDPLLQERHENALALHDALRTAVDSVVVLSPRLFLDGLLLPYLVESILRDGVLQYPLDPEQRVSWISHRDLAKAVVIAIDEMTRPGVYDLGLSAITGTELANRIGGGLKRKVDYKTISPTRFSKKVAPASALDDEHAIRDFQKASLSDHTLAISVESRQLGVTGRLSIGDWAKLNLQPMTSVC